MKKPQSLCIGLGFLIRLLTKSHSKTNLFATHTVEMLKIYPIKGGITNNHESSRKRDIKKFAPAPPPPRTERIVNILLWCDFYDRLHSQMRFGYYHLIILCEWTNTAKLWRPLELSGYMSSLFLYKEVLNWFFDRANLENILFLL